MSILIQTTRSGIDGQLAITIAGETQVAAAGCAAIIPPDAAHSVKALTA